MPFEKFLRGLGREVYVGLVPVDASLDEGAAGYLPDLWRQAPFKVALVHTGLAILMSVLPLFLLLIPRRFGRLRAIQKQKMIEKMMRSRIYLLRLVAYGVKGHALVAVLRDPKARTDLLERVPA